MMRTETIFPMDLELHFDGNNHVKREQVWLTKDQYEMVCRAMDQSISKWLTETILSMLVCELEHDLGWKLKAKLDRPSTEERAIAK